MRPFFLHALSPYPLPSLPALAKPWACPLGNVIGGLLSHSEWISKMMLSLPVQLGGSDPVHPAGDWEPGGRSALRTGVEVLLKSIVATGVTIQAPPPQPNRDGLQSREFNRGRPS
ncbi:hypothetical protein PVAP13_4NG141600 [Panicum virgatum]|uniref:Uncharacterized protein n=1 Tax=Panicum virgatum TaxID=38727 RepID=A0A8T0T390_PANVG|nr:hypothetical protein PVAP13_4NG141600 [Panicum virgatum]